MTDVSETRVLDAVTDMNLVSLDSITQLDAEAVLLVRFAALVALDAPPVSYLLHLSAAGEANISPEKVEDVLLALAPLVGSARIASAGTKIARALGIAVFAAELDAEAAGQDY